MDLALEMGMTVGELKRRMTARELADWFIYAEKKFLPTRRMEYYLARIAQVTAGGALTDFLLVDPLADAAPTAAGGGSMIAALAGKGVRVVKVKKKAPKP